MISTGDALRITFGALKSCATCSQRTVLSVHRLTRGLSWKHSEKRPA